jgi:molecular chaperone DnaK (HSP70)
MPAPGFALGIDFGTSNTVAVARTPDGRVRTLLFDGSPLLPSAVYANFLGPEPDTLRVGRDAVLSARLDPARFEPQPKRRVDDGSVLLGDRAVPVVDLIAAVLGRVAEEWRRVVGDARPDVTLTCPASWAGPRRGVLAEAAEAAGLGTVSFVAEPVAAAAYFVHVLGHTMPTGSVLVVHDMGAGTFDVTAVARTASGFEVVAVAGRDDLGGADLDAALVDHLGATAGIDHRWVTDPETVEERRWRRLLWDDVTAAKERLSRAVTAEILVPAAGVEAHLTRSELESAVGPALTESVTVTAKLAAAHGATGVFLVGGTSRIPLLSTLLFRALGRAPVAIEQPELVVAEGSVVPGVPRDPAPATAQPTTVVPVLGPPPAAPVAPRNRRARWLPAALMPLAAASATVVVAVATLVVLGVGIGALVGWSILTGQGFLPDWGWLPTAPWSDA